METHRFLLRQCVAGRTSPGQYKVLAVSGGCGEKIEPSEDLAIQSDEMLLAKRKCPERCSEEVCPSYGWIT